MHSLVAAAQREHEIVSARAVVALKAAKARGKRLGNPRLSQARWRAIVVNMERADFRSEKVLPVIQEIQESGVKSLRGIARALVARGIPTARGGEWTAVQVSAILHPRHDWFERDQTISRLSRYIDARPQFWCREERLSEPITHTAKTKRQALSSTTTTTLARTST
jgi:hypothetical protein